MSLTVISTPPFCHFVYKRTVSKNPRTINALEGPRHQIGVTHKKITVLVTVCVACVSVCVFVCVCVCVCVMLQFTLVRQ